MYRNKIEEARAAGSEWVVLLEESGEDGAAPARKLEMHLDTGVVVESAARRGDDGRMRYTTESYFVNRNTGLELACGSRKWNVGQFETATQWEQAVAAAKNDVYQRFAGLIAVQRRQRAMNRN